MPRSKLFFQQALLPDGWAADVAVTVDEEGTIAAVAAGAERAGADACHAIGLPGMPNLHSHTFQRGMAGLAETAGPGADSFWTWRAVMYRFLDRLAPDDVEALAAQACVEMLEGGFTSLAEFHYLHHAPDGLAYADRAELAERVIAGARTAGIGLTLLPAFYAHGGFGPLPPAPAQRRFLHDLDGFAHLLETLRRRHPDLVLGIAPHSLRAVTMGELRELVAAWPAGPVHLHVAEQRAEVEACLAHAGARPVEWLLGEAAVDRRWCLVHATHMTDTETTALARSDAVAGLCPLTESNLGDGIFEGVAFAESGGRLGVGSDSNVRIDAAAELATLEYSQRLRHRRRNCLARPGSSTGASLYRAALAGGAQALAQPVGALAAGTRADIVTLDARHPALAGKTGDALLDGWLFAAARSPVESVYVGGRRLVSGGRHLAAGAVARKFARATARLLA